MLPLDVTRCAGFLPQTQHDRCPRRPDCARFRSRATTTDGKLLPFEWSACEAGDAFVHVATVADDGAADHPQAESSVRVLDAGSVRTTCAAGGA